MNGFSGTSSRYGPLQLPTGTLLEVQPEFIAPRRHPEEGAVLCARTLAWKVNPVSTSARSAASRISFNCILKVASFDLKEEAPNFGIAIAATIAITMITIKSSTNVKALIFPTQRFSEGKIAFLSFDDQICS